METQSNQHANDQGGVQPHCSAQCCLRCSLLETSNAYLAAIFFVGGATLAVGVMLCFLKIKAKRERSESQLGRTKKNEPSMESLPLDSFHHYESVPAVDRLNQWDSSQVDVQVAYQNVDPCCAETEELYVNETEIDHRKHVDTSAECSCSTPCRRSDSKPGLTPASHLIGTIRQDACTCRHTLSPISKRQTSLTGSNTIGYLDEDTGGYVMPRTPNASSSSSVPSFSLTECYVCKQGLEIHT